jgi:DMSO reductase anchor subunit
MVAAVYAASLWLIGPAEAGPYVRIGVDGHSVWTWGPASAGPSAVLGGLTTLLGFAGVTASACIYRVPSRPAWNTSLTLAQFFLTAALLGFLFATAIGAGDRGWLGMLGACGAAAQLLLLALRFFQLIASDSIELRGSARLLSTTLRSQLLMRGGLLLVGGVVLPIVAVGPLMSGSAGHASTAILLWTAFLLALAGEILGRYLFFVSVVPKHMAAPYLTLEAA